jgi:hypothetical protein
MSHLLEKQFLAGIIPILWSAPLSPISRTLLAGADFLDFLAQFYSIASADTALVTHRSLVPLVDTLAAAVEATFFCGRRLSADDIIRALRRYPGFPSDYRFGSSASSFALQRLPLSPAARAFPVPTPSDSLTQSAVRFAPPSPFASTSSASLALPLAHHTIRSIHLTLGCALRADTPALLCR